MAHVITQPCCNDASCVSVCPVNCIHPTPDEPGFTSAEMLFIDPDTCIDCGLCLDECPVAAIVPEDELGEGDARYLRINADYYRDHDVDGGLASAPKRYSLPEGKALHVAIVGAGPAAFYAAQELLKYQVVKVDMFDRLPTPYGLVRAGVAPDHQQTKRVDEGFAATAAKRGFEYLLGVEVGTHVQHRELTDRYGAVVYAHGAARDKKLGIDGEDLPGSISATDFVAWYNGHPDYANMSFDLTGETAVVIGNGNVALDVARVLLDDPVALARTDIAEHALTALRESRISEVVLVARRGVAQAAYTIGEFLAMGDIAGVDVVIDPTELALDAASALARKTGTLDSTVATKVRIAEEFAARESVPGNKRVVFRYLLSPVEINGSTQSGITGLRCVRNALVESADSSEPTVQATGEYETLPTALVMRAIGYTGTALSGIPFDRHLGVVPNEGGRVLDSSRHHSLPGVYVTGWIKRGATGGIGANRKCGEETARAVIADFATGDIPDRDISARDDIGALIRSRGATIVNKAGWQNIDTTELAAGSRTGRTRLKLVSADELYAAAQGN